jgi:hypothetical protein
MRGGHNRKPLVVKKAQGTFIKSRDSKVVGPDLVIARIGDPPSDFSVAEKKAWRKLIHSVKYTYCDSDKSTFELLVKLWARFETEGRSMPASPYARLIQSLSSLLQQFGCTPAARDRVSANSESKPGKSEEAEADDFLFEPPKLVTNAN